MLDFNNFINESKTIPWYKKGELIVLFKPGVKSDDVVKYILKKLNIKAKLASGHQGAKGKLAHVQMNTSMKSDYFIITTPIGKENEVMELLKTSPDIEWVERRDMKSELRYYIGSYLSEQIEEISTECDVSDTIWKEKLSEMAELMLLLISDKYESIGNRYPYLKSVIDEKLG